MVGGRPAAGSWSGGNRSAGGRSGILEVTVMRQSGAASSLDPAGRQELETVGGCSTGGQPGSWWCGIDGRAPAAPPGTACCAAARTGELVFAGEFHPCYVRPVNRPRAVRFVDHWQRAPAGVTGAVTLRRGLRRGGSGRRGLVHGRDVRVTQRSAPRMLRDVAQLGSGGSD
jgi:hypothetical protein